MILHCKVNLRLIFLTVVHVDVDAELFGFAGSPGFLFSLRTLSESEPSIMHCRACLRLTVLTFAYVSVLMWAVKMRYDFLACQGVSGL